MADVVGSAKRTALGRVLGLACALLSVRCSESGGASATDAAAREAAMSCECAEGGALDAAAPADAGGDVQQDAEAADASPGGPPDATVDAPDAGLAEAGAETGTDTGSTCVGDAQPAVACPAGISPGTPPAFSCSGNVPVITSSGVFPISLTGAPHDVTLPCGLGYSGPRDIVFGMCLGRTRSVTIQPLPSQTGASWPAWLTASCTGTGGWCPPQTTDRIPPGTYDVVVEGYADGDGNLSVTLGPPPLANVTSCADAPSVLSQDGPLDFATYGAVRATSTVVDSTLTPSCAQNHGSETNAVVPFALGCAAQVTIHASTTGGGMSNAAALTACGQPSSELACVNNVVNGPTPMSSLLLAPGTYYFALGGEPQPFSPIVEVEPPWPPPTNTTCASATTIPAGGLTEERIVTQDSRFYAFTTTKAGFQLTLSIVSMDGNADMTLGATGGCPTPPPHGTSMSGSVTTGAVVGTPFVKAGVGAPPGTYLAAVTATVGTRYSLSWQ